MAVSRSNSWIDGNWLNNVQPVAFWNVCSFYVTRPITKPFSIIISIFCAFQSSLEKLLYNVQWAARSCCSLETCVQPSGCSDCKQTSPAEAWQVSIQDLPQLSPVSSASQAPQSAGARLWRRLNSQLVRGARGGPASIYRLYHFDIYRLGPKDRY